MPSALAPRRVLRSGVLELLLGPHGVDRYLELIRPDLTLYDARAEVVAVSRPTARAVTVRLRCNDAWAGFESGQFVRVGVEIDGVRRTRTYSPAGSQLGDRRFLELTITEHPGGLVSPYMRAALRPGAVLHLGDAAGAFTLSDRRPERLVLISGGSGITPVMSMLRTLCDEGHAGEITFLHYSRTSADALYRAEASALAARHPGLSVQYVATREGGAHLTDRTLGDLEGATVAVCGPPSLIDAAAALGLEGDRLLTETFTPPVLTISADGTAEGTLSFLRSGATAPIAGGTLLEQAEAAGLTPEFGCRMGICHTCTCRKATGPVRNLLTGEISDEEDEDIQLCVSVPAGTVALEI